MDSIGPVESAEPSRASPVDRLLASRALENGPRRSNPALGCLMVIMLLVLLVGGCLFTAHRNGGGIADEAALRPLPPNVEVVRETAGCPGSGEGWHSCERRLRLRRPGTSAEQLQVDVLAHYRSSAVSVRAIGQQEDCPGMTLSRPDRELNDYLCVYVERARAATEPGSARLVGDEVDVVAQTFANVT